MMLCFQGSSSDKVESAPWVRTCITRVPAGNSKSQIVLPDMLTKWSNTPWSYRFMLVLQELSLGDLPSKQTSWDLAEPPNHWLQTRSWRKTGENAPLPMHFLFHLFKKKNIKKENKNSKWSFMISCLKPWRKKCPALQIYSGFKMIFEKLQEFLTSAIETFPPPNLYPPHDLHPNSPFITALVWRLNKPKVLHPASSKMFKTRTFAFATRPPLQRERKLWETGAVSAAGV